MLFTPLVSWLSEEVRVNFGFLFYRYCSCQVPHFVWIESRVVFRFLWGE